MAGLRGGPDQPSTREPDPDNAGGGIAPELRTARPLCQEGSFSLRTIVVANGELGDSAILRARLASWAKVRVIAADGAAANCRELGLQPEIIVGDLDSLDSTHRSELEAAGVELLRSPARKDQTDLELALLYAKETGAEQVIVLGALGGRLDMTLANVLMLTHPRLVGLDLQLWHDDQTAWILRPPGGDVHGQPGDLLSLIPVGGDVQGVVTHGLEYLLRNEILSFGPARGVSNVLTGREARVELSAGLLLTVHTPAIPLQAGGA